MSYLFLFSISPVQSFISQARKTKDLYMGSFLLSKFIKEQLKFLKDKVNNAEVIFPSDLESESLPNRFVVKLTVESEQSIQELGDDLQENFRKILEDEFNRLPPSISRSQNKQKYLDQLLNTFETYWASVKLEDNYKDAYLKLEKIHAAAKNIKKFRQTGEEDRKCSVCGERRAYFYGDYDPPAFLSRDLAVCIANMGVQFVKNEVICTVCAMKRLQKVSFYSVAEIALKGAISDEDIKKLPYDNAELFYDENLTKHFFEKNGIPVEELSEVKSKKDEILDKYGLKPSQLPKYYALIMFDGDNMGKLLAGEYLKGGIELEEFHKELSRALSENAKKAKEIVDRHGKAVYAGGDDFLGFVPLKDLMLVLKELRKQFKDTINDRLLHMLKDGKEITMSAGVAIAHYKTPLKTVLDWARAMEKEAKELGGRNAFAIAVLKHSGEIHKTVWKWFNDRGSNIDRIEKILDKLIRKKFSTNFIHTLEEEFSRLDYENNSFYNEQFETELKRLITKSAIVKSDQEDERKELYELCKSLHSQCKDKKKGDQCYFSLMRIIDFIARQLGGER